ncbi:unnamed protein product [Pleuronectes platessa]|uniref:Uncharacterized protein n=1 Tax=Pleuronectes platessa TaxID=8262 RepID=A0A9N7TJP2_PLEPL|nr:unnamed protein product [Pleuronectes platessa]
MKQTSVHIFTGNLTHGLNNQRGSEETLMSVQLQITSRKLFQLLAFATANQHERATREASRPRCVQAAGGGRDIETESVSQPGNGGIMWSSTTDHSELRVARTTEA